MEAVRIQAKLIIAAMFCDFALCPAYAQADPGYGSSSSGLHHVRANERQDTDHRREPDLLNQDDRLSLIAAALDARVRRNSEPDCSHLVHAIYAQAGFPYSYAPSSELYAGVEGFQRVKQPQPGDLIVWRGHAGIVIKPSQHIFFSFMSSGPGIDDYEARYWKSRGRPRFYRYLKYDSCSGCAWSLPPAHQRIKINR